MKMGGKLNGCELAGLSYDIFQIYNPVLLPASFFGLVFKKNYIFFKLHVLVRCISLKRNVRFKTERMEF